MAGPTEIHVWRCSLTAGAGEAARLAETLSPDDRTRAGRFHFEDDRRRFIAARAFYRRVLARYAGLSPSALPLTSVHGEKPRSPALSLAHNLSHAQDLALVAVAPAGDLGVDVEFLERPVDLPALARVAMTAREHAEWTVLAPEARTAAFFSIWTRKEAVLKAIGDRRAFEFRDLDVAALGQTWRIAAFTPSPGYRAAIALRLLEQPHAELLRLRLFGDDDDDGLGVRGDAAGALDLADGGLNFVH